MLANESNQTRGMVGGIAKLFSGIITDNVKSVTSWLREGGRDSINIPDADGRLPLAAAASMAKVEIVTKLLKSRADPNAGGCAALLHAATSLNESSLSCVNLLIDAKADVLFESNQRSVNDS